MGVTPRLTLLHQQREFLLAQERLSLGVKQRRLALVREIRMGKGEQHWLFARTVIPQETLSGSAKRVLFLKNAPIGKILFGRKGARRKSMHIGMSNTLPQTVFDMGIKISHPLWERRSIFEFTSGPVLVSEIFLPDCPVYSSSSIS